MTTSAQLEANRANSQLSTGPRTADGKARSARNSRRHGLFVPVESLAPVERELYDEFLAHHTGQWDPDTAEEDRLVVELALTDFRRNRARALESAWYAERIEQLRKDDGLPESLTPQQAIRLQARAFQHDCDSSQSLSRLFRWERAFNRDFERLAFQLHALILNRANNFVKTKPILRQTVDNMSPVTSATASAGDAGGHNPPPPPQNVDPSVPALRPARQSEASPYPETPQTTRVAIPRNAPCTCGSGLKFKRCCGRHAPPQLFPGVRAA